MANTPSGSNGDIREFKGTITLPGGTTEAFDQTKDRTWEIATRRNGAVTLTNEGPGQCCTIRSSPKACRSTTEDYYKSSQADNKGMNVHARVAGRQRQAARSSPRSNKTTWWSPGSRSNPNGHTYDNIAIEDLLPAGLEVENPNLDTAQALPWLTTSSTGAPGGTSGTTASCSSPSRFPGHSTFYYLARAVTPGKFTVPPVSAECMYDPEVRSVTSQSEMTIAK